MSRLADAVNTHIKGDRWIWAILLCLGLTSMLAVYSASTNLVYRFGENSTEYYLLRQFIVFGIGLIVTFIVHKIHFLHYWKLINYLYLVAALLLIYTLINGVEINDAKRWIQVPILGFTFQPSDFAKLALVMATAKLLSTKVEIFGSRSNMFFTIIGAIMFIILLIAPMDFSTAGILFSVCFILMIAGDLKVKYLLGTVGLFVLGVLFLFLLGSILPESVRVTTWTARMSEFIAGGGEEYQVLLSKIAIANGGIYGVGPGNSAMASILPSSYADFIYAVITEEYGLIGAVLILAAYVMLLVRVTIIAKNCNHKFAGFLVYGLGILLVIQAFFNIAVSINLVPVTGLTLPMVSKGGTSTLLTCIAFGIMLSISRYAKAEKLKEMEPATIND